MSRTFADSLDYDAENVFFSVNEFARAYSLSRGVKTTPDVAAITSVRVYERVDESGIVTELEATDFDLPASSYLIDGVQDLDPAWLQGGPRVALTAGASAPEVLVSEVIEKLKSWGACSSVEYQGIEEKVVFSLPKGLRRTG